MFAGGQGEFSSPYEEPHEDDVNLLITDVVMPEMDGVELAVQIRRLRPNLPVLFISGFRENIPGSFEQWEGVDKPFKPQELLKKIADIRKRLKITRTGQSWVTFDGAW